MTSGPQSRHGPEVPAVARRRRRIDPDGRVDVRARRGKQESRRHHADDFGRRAINQYASADGILLPAEPPLPDAIAQHDDRRRAADIVLRADRSAEHRRHSQDLEEPGGHAQSRYLNGFALTGKVCPERSENAAISANERLRARQSRKF